MTFFGTLGHLIAILIGVVSLGIGSAPQPEIPVSLPAADTRPPGGGGTLAELGAVVSAALRESAAYQQATVTAGTRDSEVPAPAIVDALVNVHCTARTGERHYTTSGSGVLIGTHGVVLTNAHVAHFLLLPESTANSTATCVIRTGSPATNRYHAELLYLPPTWITENADQLYAEHQVGTGERDFALLRITDAVTGVLPKDFPDLPLAPRTYSFRTVETMYAAGYLPGEDDVLSARIATTSIHTLFTFTDNIVDLIALTPSTVGVHGASGGPVVDKDGMLIGLIATHGNPETEGTQSLRALTIPYIDRALETETGLSLTQTLSGDLALRSRVFLETLVPPLRAYLEAEARLNTSNDS